MLTGFCGFAQDDVEVKGNTVTMRETAPIWPGCESADDKKECWNKNFMDHVKQNYKYPKNEKGEYIRGKATVSMEITEKGNVVVTKVEGDNPKVNAAAKKMIMSIPKMTPGKLAGKPRAIKYTIPLTF
ncbi:energy transducer TonB [Gramella aestuarii]|uniref:Energy transducer TonB n=2 Tax=Christiangramia aestuarii TaxID=1028746 RepID=A0A7K1LMG6_9FLAO|nr:energy transducer TonB [Christiangramia aestuarii]